MDCCDGHEIGSICGGHALPTSDFEKHMVVLFMLVCITSDHVQDFNLLEATHMCCLIITTAALGKDSSLLFSDRTPDFGLRLNPY